MRRIGPFGIFTGFFTVVRMDVIIVLPVFLTVRWHKVCTNLGEFFGRDLQAKSAFGGLSFNGFGEQ